MARITNQHGGQAKTHHPQQPGSNGDDGVHAPFPLQGQFCDLRFGVLCSGRGIQGIGIGGQLQGVLRGLLLGRGGGLVAALGAATAALACARRSGGGSGNLIVPA